MYDDPIWYNYLVKQEDEKKRYLLSDTPPKNSLIICHEIEKNHRKYALFGSYLLFFNYIIERIDIEKFSFYEVIGNTHQKPYFDFDINLDDNYELVIKDAYDSINGTIEKIKELYPQIKDSNIQVYNSNSISALKLSYHIIIDRFCFTSNRENKQFYNNVIRDLDIKYKPDNNLYSSLQNFRMYGSHKPEELEMRTKKLDKDLNRWINPNRTDDITTFVQIYLASLITNTSYCSILSSQDIEEYKSYINESLLNLEEISKSTEIFRNHLPLPFPYEITKSYSNKIYYRRIYASYCEFCEKIHTRQGSYLSLTTKNKDIYYNCNNTPTKGKLIGSLIYKNRKLTKPILKIKSEIREFRNCQKGERFSLKNTRVKLTYNYDLDENFFRENVENKINNFIKDKVTMKNYIMYKDDSENNLIITHIAIEFSNIVTTTKNTCLTFDLNYDNPKIEGVTTLDDYEWLCNELIRKQSIRHQS